MDHSSRTSPTVGDPSTPHRWYGWGSPVGMGIGLLSVGGFWFLFTLGLQALASTPY